MSSYFWECVKGAMNPKCWNYSNLKYSTIFTIEEKNKMLSLLEECGQKPNSDKIEFYWNTKMEYDCIGCFSILKPNSIFISEKFRYDIDSMDFKRIMATAAHELRHRQQFLRLTILYLILCIPLVRNLTIEVDAERIGLKVDTFFNFKEDERL